MAWPVRSKLLVAHQQVASNGVLYNVATVPTGKTWLIKEWTAYNGTSGTRSLFMVLTIGSDVYIWAGTLAWLGSQVAGTPDRHLVAPAGSVISYQCGGTGLIQLLISGAELGP